MSEQILRKLYKGDDWFLRLRYVLRAVGRKDVRYYLNYLFVDEQERAVGCDGHRLHIAKDSNLPAGFYELVKNSKSEIWLATVPDIDTKEYPKYDENVLSLRPKGNKQWLDCSPAHPDQAIFHVFSHFQTCIKTSYVLDALCCDFGDLRVACKDNLSPVFFDYDGEVQGVVMPMRVETAQKAA